MLLTWCEHLAMNDKRLYIIFPSIYLLLCSIHFIYFRENRFFCSLGSHPGDSFENTQDFYCFAKAAKFNQIW